MLAANTHLISVYKGLGIVIYFGLATFTFYHVQKNSRQSPGYTQKFIFISSLVCLTSFLSDINFYNYIFFLASHITLFNLWFSHSYMKAANSLYANNRYQLLINGSFPRRHHQKFQVINISNSGCLLETSEKLVIGEEYSLEFKSVKYCTNIKALVVRKTSEQNYGVIFKQIDQRKYANLDDFFNYLLKEHGHIALAKSA